MLSVAVAAIDPPEVCTKYSPNSFDGEGNAVKMLGDVPALGAPFCIPNHPKIKSPFTVVVAAVVVTLLLPTVDVAFAFAFTASIAFAQDVDELGAPVISTANRRGKLKDVLVIVTTFEDMLEVL